jgi:hypothetical protein
MPEFSQRISLSMRKATSNSKRPRKHYDHRISKRGNECDAQHIIAAKNDAWRPKFQQTRFYTRKFDFGSF